MVAPLKARGCTAALSNLASPPRRSQPSPSPGGDRSRATVARGGGTAGALGQSPQQTQPSRGPRGAGSEPWWDGNTDSSSSPRARPRERRSGHWHSVMGKVPLSNGKRLGAGESVAFCTT